MDAVEALAVDVGTAPSGTGVVAGERPDPGGEPVAAAVLPGEPETPWSAPVWFHRMLVVAAVAAIAVGIVLRFWTRTDMWLDEALTFNISRLPLSQIQGALRRDGAPPLYYYLLHFWSGAFGSSDTAVRALSGVFSCATLPFIWLAGRRLGGT